MLLSKDILHTLCLFPYSIHLQYPINFHPLLGFIWSLMSILPQLYTLSKTIHKNFICHFLQCYRTIFVLLHTPFLQRYRSSFHSAPHTLSTTLRNPFLLCSTHPFHNVMEPLSNPFHTPFPQCYGTPFRNTTKPFSIATL